MSIDIGYIRTVLFPELYSYDIPQPLSMISYSRFTSTFTLSIKTGVDDGGSGAGFAVWYPKVSFGPSFFYLPCSSQSLTSRLPLAFTNGVLNTSWNPHNIQIFPTYFSQTALVAASVSLQYIGTLQTESGMIKGGQVLSAGIDSFDKGDVEEAQFSCLTKPGNGLRLVYLPRDDKDFSFYPCKIGLSHNGGAEINDSSWKLTGGLKYANNYTAPVDIVYSNTAPFFGIYWEGLPANLTYLRFDFTAKFNAVPNKDMRDFVQVDRPKKTYDAKKTTDILQQLILNVPKLGGHQVKEMDRVSDQIQAFLPNVGHLYQNGGLKSEFTSLESFSGALALQEAGLQGSQTNVGRIWNDGEDE